MDEIRLGPVTLVLDPPEASELSQLLGHVLYNMPEAERLSEQQRATAHFLGQAALKLSAALVQAMKDAGVSDEMIARVTGQIQASPRQVADMEEVRNQAMEQLAQEMQEQDELPKGEPVNDPHLPTYGPEDDNAPAAGSNFHPQDPDLASSDPPNPVPDAPARGAVQQPNLARTDPVIQQPEGVPPREGAS